MTSLAFVCVLASLSARSLASEPELTKKQTFRGSGNRLVSLSAYSTRLSCRKRELVFSTRSCWPATSAIFGWLCPTENGGFSYNQTREHRYNKYREPRCLCSQDIFRPFHWTCTAPGLIIFSGGRLWKTVCMKACKWKIIGKVIYWKNWAENENKYFYPISFSRSRSVSLFGSCSLTSMVNSTRFKLCNQISRQSK